MKSKIWLIGGTSESIAIAKLLTTNEILFTVSVVTPDAQALYPIGTQVLSGCMSQTKMQFFCLQENIRAVIDASHPYAVEVSTVAIAVTNQLNIPYLRYERSNHQTSNLSKANSLITELDSLETLLAGDYLQAPRVLLTIGCKALPKFQAWQSKSTLYARVLPTIESLTIANQAGFTSDRLIAIRPPFSIALETALWQQWNICLVITKASGTAGGEDIKLQVAADLNIPLVIITRPKITYPQQTSTLEEVLTFCRSTIK
jgi:precorrin-6A/cobalt-precorrin-6A reductase